LNGFDSISVTFSNDGNTSHPISFLVSTDGKTLAKMDKYDISADPRNLVSAEGRPSRGGPDTAPVLIVGFDDLECPYCARLHTAIFPAIVSRYGDKVHFVYKDFPLPADMHPWAMRAAVDVNCVAAQSPAGYWNMVDYIHAHASEIGNAAPVAGSDAPGQKTLDLATSQLDKLARGQGEFQKLDMTKLNACLENQDTTAIKASTKVGESLNVDSTPSLFINGDKIDGAVPLEFIFGVIDNALRVEGVTPPPPYVAPTPVVTPAGPAASKPTGK
jgi:protein-disulfide isomerase